MESNEQTEQAKQRQNQIWRADDSYWLGELREQGLNKKEKGFMDMDNSVVIAGGRGYKGTKW